MEKVRFGLCNCAYGIVTQAEDGSLTFGTPVMIPNAKSLTMDRTISTTPIFADNKKIYTISAFTGANLTVGFTLLTDELKQAILGHKADSKGHDVEVTNAKTTYFYFIYQVEGDTKSRRRVILKCSATLGSEATETTSDSVNVNGDSLAISVYPVEDGKGNDIACYDVDSSDIDYADVLTKSPAIPTFAS